MAEKHNSKELVTSISVVVDPNRSLEGALRKFKKKVDSAGVLREYRKREFYKKPSVAKKEKRKAAQKRRDKESRKGELEVSRL